MPGSKLRVLWATDGSVNAKGAIRLLQQLILPAAERLTVLTVAPHSFLGGARPDLAFLTKATPAAKKRALIESHESAERDLIALDPATPSVEAISRWGHPIEAILKVARSGHADLLVLGAKGHSNLGLILLGSVTQGVVQHATQPVLVARPGAEARGRILVGFDGSPPSRRAISFLQRLDLAPDIELVLCYVVEPFAVPPGTPITYRAQAIAEAHKINLRLHRRAERALNRLGNRLEAGGRRVTCEFVSGQASAELEESARRNGANLIVVGSRKPSPARHYLLASTAEKLVRHSQTSVLVVR